MFIVGSCRSGGIYALDWVRREFPNHFCNFIFMNVRTVDAVSFGGPEALESVRRDADKTLDYFVNFCNNRGLAAQVYLGFGTDPIQELTKLSEVIRSEFPHSIFFTSKLIFEQDNWYIRQLHSEAALTLLRRLHMRNIPMIVLPMKL